MGTIFIKPHSPPQCQNLNKNYS